MKTEKEEELTINEEKKTLLNHGAQERIQAGGSLDSGSTPTSNSTLGKLLST